MRRIIISDNHEPAWNLAFEEYLIETGDDILYLWQNQDTVVIGRNQNPYRECNLKAMRDDNVRLVRRKSGGGAVFHDLGNLNFTLISEKKEGCAEENFSLVIRALELLGIEAQISGRNDIICNGKKISGNAFAENNGRFCHHGTLLIDVETGRLNRYLTASPLKMKSKGIDSVRSRVMNLKDINEEISVEGICSSFEKVYREEADAEKIEVFTLDMMKSIPKVREKAEIYESWQWTCGESPEADIVAEEKFPWGIVQVGLTAKDGVMENVSISTDSIICDDFQLLSKTLKGKKMQKSVIQDAIDSCIKNQQVNQDLKSLVDSY